MEWSKLNNHGKSPEKAFESLCNQLFENWCLYEYKDNIKTFNVINGSGGDGGVESIAILNNGNVIAMQAKWFIYSINQSQIKQVKKSIETALEIRPNIIKYVICVPRDLSSVTRKSKEGNCEEKRWNKFVEEINREHPNLEISTWTNYLLDKELQKSENVGIHKFWFNELIITRETIKESFNRAKNTWLLNKYVPDLDVKGSISKEIECLLGVPSEIADAKRKLERAIDLCITIHEKCDYLFEIKKDIISGEDKKQLKTLISNVDLIKAEGEKVVRYINNPRTNMGTMDEGVLYIDFSSIHNYFDCGSFSDYHFHMYEIKNDIYKLSQIHTYDIFRSLKKYIERKNIFVIGNPGTGKTHAISSISDRLIAQHTHIPIVIDGKRYQDDTGWKQIICKTLDLKECYTEEELFLSLIALANNCKLNPEFLNSDIPVVPKILIFVDALDESRADFKWKQRIKEAVSINRKYKQIYFCFTSRNGFDTGVENQMETIHLNSDGDTPVYKILDLYLEEYKISVENKNWLTNFIKTPLLLKLFCQNNRDKKIFYKDIAKQTMVSIWKNNLQMIEEEYCNKTGSHHKNQTILKSINLLSKKFLSVDSIDYDNCIELLSQISNFDAQQAQDLLYYLETYGIVYSYIVLGDGINPDKFFYRKGIQGYFDFAEAKSILGEYEHPEKIDFDKFKNIDNDTLFMLTVISIIDYDYLLTKNKSLHKSGSHYLIEELQWIALINTNHKNCKQFIDRTKKIMGTNANGLFTVVNNLILPLSRDIDHPLGVKILHEFLGSFKKPAIRDILWSTPIYYDEDKKNYYLNYELRLNEEPYLLNKGDNPFGLPLVYAWALSSVDNKKRNSYECELAKWSTGNLNNFFNLFLEFINVNDPQILSSLFSILAYSFYKENNKEVLLKVTNWIMDKVLVSNETEVIRDISIRYYALAMLYRSKELGVLSDVDIENFKPPYKVSKNEIDVNQDAFVGSRMGGYSLIEYDLSRYVLIDPIDHIFNSFNQKNSLDKLVSEICAKKNIDTNINSDQFILGAAYAYLLKTGWNENDFHINNATKQNGIDSYIQGKYYPATHGSKSMVMTVCEKYIWQFKNYIYAFLSDRLKIAETNDYVKDYGDIEDFPFLLDENFLLGNSNFEIYLPEYNKLNIDKRLYSKVQLIDTAKNLEELDIEKWIIINNENNCFSISDPISLFSFTEIQSLAGIETCIFVNTLLIDEKDQEDFIKQANNNGEIKELLSHPTEWFGGINTRCYITPVEICMFGWKSRYDNSSVNMFNSIKVASAVDESVYNIIGEDRHCYLPSKEIRDLLQIKEYEKGFFIDDSGNIKGQFNHTGIDYYESQEILTVSKKDLYVSLKKANKSIIWLFREQRRESGTARERYGEFWLEKSNSYIVYLDKESLKTIKISSDFKFK